MNVAFYWESFIFKSNYLVMLCMQVFLKNIHVRCILVLIVLVNVAPLSRIGVPYVLLEPISQFFSLNELEEGALFFAFAAVTNSSDEYVVELEDQVAWLSKEVKELEDVMVRWEDLYADLCKTKKTLQNNLYLAIVIGPVFGYMVRRWHKPEKKRDIIIRSSTSFNIKASANDLGISEKRLRSLIDESMRSGSLHGNYTTDRKGFISNQALKEIMRKKT